MQKFNVNSALYQLSMERPNVVKRFEAELRAMLGEVNNAVVARYQRAKPGSSVIYLGDLHRGKRGVVLRLDYQGRITAGFVESPRLMRRLWVNNHLQRTLETRTQAQLTDRKAA